VALPRFVVQLRFLGSVGNVALARAQVPAQLIQGFAFRVHLGGDDLLVFLQRDGAFVFEADGGPLAFGDTPWQFAG